MAVIVADGMPTGLTTSDFYAFHFARVDLASSTFHDEAISISFEPFGAVVNRELDKPRGLKTSVRFGSITVPAGDYVYIRRIDGRSLGGTDTCYSQGARVMKLEAGRVNIVTLGSVTGPTRVDPATVEKQVRQVLAGYPGVTAPVVHAPWLGLVRFDTAQQGMNRCRPMPGFSFSSQEPARMSIERWPDRLLPD